MGGREAGRWTGPAGDLQRQLRLLNCDMVKLADVQKQVVELSFEEKEGLLAFLIHELSGPVSGADDEEVLRREEEMDSGAVAPISHEEFLQRVGRPA